MSVFSSPSFDQHELVHFAVDPATGLRAIIAVHNSNLGPGCGGCRLWPYADEQSAVEDVLRLSRGMSFKSALANLPLGGGKAVIMADSTRRKTPELMRAFGRAVDSLGGRYITAEDVGITVEDMAEVAKETRYVSGLPDKQGACGDPSPFTAEGVFQGMRAAMQVKWGSEDMQGKRVLVQGVGNVGYHLCRRLVEAGATLSVADVNGDNLARAVKDYGVDVVPVDAVFDQDMDIFSPCALGAVLDDDSIPRLTAGIVAGGANNQLAGERHGRLLMERGILYAPDYVINAGGIINVWAELAGAGPDQVEEKVAAIYHTTLNILRVASSRDLPADTVADQLAMEKINAAKPEQAATTTAVEVL